MNQSSNQKVQQNTPLFTDIYFADPSAHVFDGKLYVYPSHDVDSGIGPDDTGDQYAMRDYHVIEVNPEKGCVDHGVAIAMEDIPWVKKQLWAPDAAYKDGKYYLFFPAKDKDDIFRIGVAISDSPTGPFKAQPEYMKGSHSIDPAVLMDDDGESYLYVGGLWGGQLENWQTGEFSLDSKEPTGDQEALGPKVAKLRNDLLELGEEFHLIKIVDENGNPLLAKEEDKRFFEGAWVHKYKGLYYLSYSTGTTHTLAYAISESPYGPFTYKGTILDPVEGWTTHHSIVEFEGKWFLFYHDASISKRDNLRSVMFTEIKYDENGCILKVNRDLR